MPLKPCSVAVVSGASGFAGRLSRHMLNTPLPGEADVHHVSFGALGAARAHYDLVIVGAGDSLFRLLIGEDLIDLLARGKASISLFGTQYRELFPRAGIERLVGRLDYLLMYGRGRKHAEHLGDWLIDIFPLDKASDPNQLRVGEELDNEPSVRASAAIQRHKAVFCTRPHPLLCALTAADMTAYAEQPAQDAPGIVSGTFRSMLMSATSSSWSTATRSPATRRASIARLRERIEATLRNVAVAAV